MMNTYYMVAFMLVHSYVASLSAIVAVREWIDRRQYVKFPPLPVTFALVSMFTTWELIKCVIEFVG